MEVTGRIVKTNEHYFEVADDRDRHHRFAVALDATLPAGELAQLARDGTRVLVIAHDDMPDLPVAYHVLRAPSA